MSDPFADLAAPSLDDFAALADAAFKTLPQPFKRLAGEDLTDRSVLDPVPHLSQVFLYRRPILDEWAERGDVTLGELITNVLVHEIGHHFGLSDADIHRAEDQA